LRVKFYRSGERHYHVVETVIDNNGTPTLESVDDDSDWQWPPSPPLQALQIHSSNNGGRAILLTGAAGSSYWSMGLETKLDPFPRSVWTPKFENEWNEQFYQLEFDVACRVKERPLWLGNCYRGLNDVVFTSRDTHAIVTLPQHRGLLFVAGLSDTQFEVAYYQRERTFAARPPTDFALDLPTTKRWAYRMVLVAG
jgi:hypothetical protein